MDINQFTLNAQNALQAAQSLASELGQQQVDNEHLFLALLRQEESVVDPILKRMSMFRRSICSWPFWTPPAPKATLKTGV
jgi:ATP-dependent Clp protease ATP-binding subunit ClpA